MLSYTFFSFFLPSVVKSLLVVEVTQAYSCLSDGQKKSYYDMFGDEVLHSLLSSFFFLLLLFSLSLSSFFSFFFFFFSFLLDLFTIHTICFFPPFSWFFLVFVATNKKRVCCRPQERRLLPSQICFLSKLMPCFSAQMVKLFVVVCM